MVSRFLMSKEVDVVEVIRNNFYPGGKPRLFCWLWVLNNPNKLADIDLLWHTTHAVLLITK